MERHNDHDRKIEFICEWRTGKYTITELCKSFEISRPTGIKIIRRFENLGCDGLLEKHRIPKSHPMETEHIIVDGIIKLKEKHRLWGAKK